MKSSEPRQLSFSFADNPPGSEKANKTGEPVGRAYLLRLADGHLTTDSDAEADFWDNDPDRLLEQVACLQTLAIALLRVADNKGAAGVDGQTVRDVVDSAHIVLPKLRDSLLGRFYIPGDIRRVWIPKPGGERRGLGIPNVIDRVVQQAVLSRINDLFEPTFHDSSHGFRVYRGAHTAIAEARMYFEEGYGTTVDIDLSKFFDRVNHQRLLGRLSERISDGRLLKLIHCMLKATVVLPDGTKVKTEEGAPQGGPLSPLLSNIVLDELDWELERRGLRFVRYADDFSVFVRSERAGHRVKASITRFIERRLRLVVNESKSSVNAGFDLTFLGFRLTRDASGAISIGISRRSDERLRRHIRELTPRTWGNRFDACVERLNRYLRGWLGYFRLCTSPDSFQSIDAHIRRRLRALLARQKKRPRYLFRHLLRCGVPWIQAYRAVYQTRGLWQRSRTPALHRAYPNRWFDDRLLNLRRSWSELSPPSASLR